MKLLSIIFIILSSVAYIVQPKKQYQNDIAIEDTSSLKFYLSILILCHHLAIQTNLFGFREFKYWGSILVGVFLFISAYGLIASYEKKQQSYLSNFFSKRLLRIYIPFLVATIFYTCLAFIGIYQNYDWNNLITLTFIHAITPLPYSWYIIFITYWYIAFYISYRFFPKYGIFCIITLTLLYLYSGINLLGAGWWIPSLSFAAGLFYFKYNQNLTFPITLFIMLIILYTIHIKQFPYSLYASIIYIPLLCIWIFEILKKININNSWIREIKQYSYEIYLMQGFPIYFLEDLLKMIYYI